MRISTIFYCIKQGIKNIFRNKMFSLASIATMGACIFLFGIFFSVVTNFQNMVYKAEEGVSIVVYFDDGLAKNRIDEIGDLLGKRAEVSDISYVSADEAWEDFQKEYFEGEEELAEGFKGDNPLADSSHYDIHLSDVSLQQALVTYAESLEGVREVKQSEATANTLSSFNVLLGYVSLAIIIILLGVSIFLISNTVMVGISVRREEIAIMKLIGATDVFVRAPFIVEGVIIGLIGSVIPLAALYYLYNNIIGYVQSKFQVLTNLLEFLPVQQVFKVLLPVGLAIGLGIGFLGSAITLRKHLKV